MDFEPYLEMIRKIAELRGVDFESNIDFDSAWKVNKILNEIQEALAWKELFLK